MLRGVQSTEELTDNAIAALIAGLGAELDAMEALYAGNPIRDIGPLPRPRTAATSGNPNPTGDFWPGGVGEVIRWPTVEVAVPDLQGDTFSIDQHESDVTPTIIVRAWLQHPKVNVLYRQCCRYGAAVYNVLTRPDPVEHRGSGFGPNVVVRRYLARWRYNPETNQRDEVQSAAIVIFYLDAPDIRP